MKTALLVMVKVQQPSIGGWGHVAIFWLFTTARDRIVLYCIVLQRIAVLQSGPPLRQRFVKFSEEIWKSSTSRGKGRQNCET